MSDLAAPPAAAPSAPPAAGRQAAFIFIFITLLLDMLALGVIIPVLPTLIVQMRGGDEVSAAHWVGLFGTLWATMQFIFMPIAGALSDAIGRRPIVLFSNFGQGVDYVFMALAPTLWVLMIGRLISGVFSASISTAFAYVADVTEPDKRAARFGMLGAAFGIGFIIGPAMGGMLGSVDPRLPFWVAGSLSLLNWLYGFFVLPESLPPDKRTPFSFRKANPIAALNMLRDSKLFGLASIKFLNDLAHVVYPATFALYAMHRYQWDAGAIGWTLAMVGVSGAVVQGALVGPIVKAIGERRALLLGLACGVAGFLIYGFAPEPWMFWLGIPVAAFWGLAGPSGQSLITRRVSPLEQGRLQGALSSMTGVAGMVGPTLFTSVFAYFLTTGAPLHLPGAAFLTASVLVMLSWLVALVAAKPLPSPA